MSKDLTLITFGDSWTWGSELRKPGLKKSKEDWDTSNDEYRLKNVWPTYLSEQLGFTKHINRSFPGASNDMIVRHLVNYILQEYLKPGKPTDDLFLTIGLTSPDRVDLYFKNEQILGDQGWMTLWPYMDIDYGDKLRNNFAKTYSLYFANPEEFVYRYINQIHYLQTFLTANNIKHLIFQSFYQTFGHVNITEWEDKPHAFTYKSIMNQSYWELIHPVTFMNKNVPAHSFHAHVKLKSMLTGEEGFKVQHPSEIGHKWWADHMKEYIVKNKLLKSIPKLHTYDFSDPVKTLPVTLKNTGPVEQDIETKKPVFRTLI